jgi:hypothetical protein
MNHRVDNLADDVDKLHQIRSALHSRVNILGRFSTQLDDESRMSGNFGNLYPINRAINGSVENRCRILRGGEDEVRGQAFALFTKKDGCNTTKETKRETGLGKTTGNAEREKQTTDLCGR